MCAMSDAAEPPAKAPRFPYVGALLCAACLVTSIWLVFKYWYCWEVTPKDLIEGASPIGLGGWENCYVHVRGRSGATIRGGGWVPGVLDPQEGGPFVEVFGEPWKAPMTGRVTSLRALASKRAPLKWIPVGDEPEDISGNWYQVGDEYLHETHVSTRPLVDASSGRWTAEPIAGLVVGAMGVFVFAAALRQWLTVRRRASGSSLDCP
ncbi:MAG: hypothetical protein ACYSU0_11165 [Planctomycetota bacterium]